MTVPPSPAPPSDLATSLPRRSGPALLAIVLAAILAAGCLGVPPGAADVGDTVTIEYTAYDLESGVALRENRTATFSVGDGTSGLGQEVERSLRGRMPGDAYEVEVVDDPSLDYNQLVEVNRTLATIPRQQTAPRADFAQFVGEPTVGQTFAAYGIYTGRVTEVTNDTVAFQIEAEDGQEDAVPSVGAVLVTHVGETEITRELRPEVDATFVIAPPSPFQPSTPLGLQPGAYLVVGASEDKIQYSRSASAEADLVGRDLRVEITVVDVTEVEAPVPTGGNYGVRPSRQVEGDPSSVLGQPLPTGSGEGDGHQH